ncbi:MAG: hypothetical protein P9F19_07495 [Candidatus Contendobacter sp.]|nr:hypothetical protein [Candidatus Contendobacter sp.]MDG4557215.1 hypothetical protein [Candidatus Contendobacter sp.]
MTHDPHRTMKPFETGVRQGQFHSLPGSAKTDPNVNRLLVSIRIVLEIVSLGARRRFIERRPRLSRSGNIDSRVLEGSCTLP